MSGMMGGQDFHKEIEREIVVKNQKVLHSSGQRIKVKSR